MHLQFTNSIFERGEELLDHFFSSQVVTAATPKFCKTKPMSTHQQSLEPSAKKAKHTPPLKTSVRRCRIGFKDPSMTEDQVIAKLQSYGFIVTFANMQFCVQIPKGRKQKSKENLQDVTSFSQLTEQIEKEYSDYYYCFVEIANWSEDSLRTLLSVPVRVIPLLDNVAPVNGSRNYDFNNILTHVFKFLHSPPEMIDKAHRVNGYNLLGLELLQLNRSCFAAFKDCYYFQQRLVKSKQETILKLINSSLNIPTKVELKEDLKNFAELSAEKKNTKKVVLAAVKKDGLLLEHASKEMRKDKEVVLAAVKQNWKAVQFAEGYLNEDVEVEDLALKQSPLAIQYVSPLWRRDRATVLERIKTDFRVIYYIDKPLQKDIQVLNAAKSAIQSIVTSYKKKTKDAIKKSGEVIEHSYRVFPDMTHQERVFMALLPQMQQFGQDELLEKTEKIDSLLKLPDTKMNVSVIRKMEDVLQELHYF